MVVEKYNSKTKQNGVRSKYGFRSRDDRHYLQPIHLCEMFLNRSKEKRLELLEVNVTIGDT